MRGCSSKSRFQNRRVSQRTVIRSLAAGALLATSFLSTFGLPEINLHQSLAGITGVPESVPAGRYLVNYSSTGALGYLLFSQSPAEIPIERALEEAKAAGSSDQLVTGRSFGGGSYVPPGATVQVVLELTADEWNVVTSHMPVGGDFESGETYEITPFTVTEAVPASPANGFQAGVRTQMESMSCVLDSETIAAGPHVWQFDNAGDQSHHVVMMCAPRLVAGDEMILLFDAFALGTPPADDNWYARSEWAGYTALVSPGFAVWNELNLEPGTYLML